MKLTFLALLAVTPAVAPPPVAPSLIAGVAAAVLGVAVSAAAAPEADRPATRDEAAAACLRGCTKKVQGQIGLSNEQKRGVCDETCACITGQMFHPDGKPRRPPSELGAVGVECARRLTPKPGGVPAATAPPPPNLTAGLDLLPGKRCKKAAMPTWTLGSDQRQAMLAIADYAVSLPAGFSARLERPDLVVVSASESAQGVRPVFELFVSPICKSYDGPTVARRIAARGLTELLAPQATEAQVEKGRWSGGLGGPVGVSLILYDVALTTENGERKLVLYVTDLGATKTFGIHAAAVCPSSGSPTKQGPCEETYFALLKSAGAAR